MKRKPWAGGKPDPLQIRTIEELEAWLAESASFEDCEIQRIDASKAMGSELSADQVTFWLLEPISGSWEAGAKRTLRRHRVTACMVPRLQRNLWPTERSCIEGLDSFRDESGLLGLEVPNIMKLTCEYLEIFTDTIEEIVEPWVDDRRWNALFDGPLPTPKEWVHRLDALGHAVTWRFYGSGSKVPEEVPHLYEGWFLQVAHRLPDVLGGIFFASTRESEQGSSLSVELQDPEMKAVFEVMPSVLATLSGSVLRSGNVCIEGSQWLESGWCRGDQE